MLGLTRITLPSLTATEFSPDAQENALAPYARALRHHRVVVALCVLLALAGAAAYLTHRTLQYTATAQILVTPLPQASDGLIGLPLIRDSGDPTRTLQTAASLLSSPAAANAAALALGTGWTQARVQTAVKVQPQGQSDIVAISATSPDAASAANIANTYAKATLADRSATLKRQVAFALSQVQARKQAAGKTDPDLALTLASQESQLAALKDGTDPTLALASAAEVPTATGGTSSVLIVLLALVAGLALGVGAALAMEMLEREVRDEEEVIRELGVPVLARVPDLPRRMLNREERPMAIPAVREAYRTMQIQLDQLAGRARTIMVTSASMGDGKTSSAVNLAVALVGGGSRVILVDFDLRKPDIAERLHLEPRRNLVTLLAGRSSLEDILIATPDFPALRVALADPEGLDSILLEALARRLPSLLEEAAELADYVIVDTPPLGEVGDALRVVPLVDVVIVAARLDHTNRQGLRTVRELLGRAGRAPAGVVIIGGTHEHRAYHVYGRHKGRSGIGRLARNPR
ncbi:MAG: lipopolysaccharide biosynthesis protein [Solirubrobacteraceae bacterium]|nr:lipopolysaccharide biosynthesis protein [Solirubrobacteraceae bacterium]